MNIMRTSDDPGECARVLCDRHVIKLTLETAQILSTVINEVVGARGEGFYRSTHRSHPCVLWAGSSREAFDWTVAHGRALAAEYTRRFGRVHASLRVIELAADLGDLLPSGPAPEPPACVLDDLKDAPLHFAYRVHLRLKHEAWAAEGRPPRWTATTTGNRNQIESEENER